MHESRQKAILIMAGPSHARGLDELNTALGRGWRVVQMTPLGGTGAVGATQGGDGCLAALVVIERGSSASTELLEQLEAEVEELPDELEGDGATGLPPA